MGSNGDQANVPTIKDAPGAASWLSRAQSHAGRARGAAQASRQRPAAPRIVAAAAKRFGLGAARRLRQSADFERLLRQGVRRKIDGYLFYMEKRETGLPRLGILISRRHSAAATERNRIKRCIREAFRLEQGRIGPIDLLVRPPLGLRPTAGMILRLREMLAALNR